MHAGREFVQVPEYNSQGLHDGYVEITHLNSSPGTRLKGREAHFRRVASCALWKGLRPRRNHWCTYSKEVCRFSSGTNGSGSVVHTIPYHTKVPVKVCAMESEPMHDQVSEGDECGESTIQGLTDRVSVCSTPALRG